MSTISEYLEFLNLLELYTTAIDISARLNEFSKKSDNDLKESVIKNLAVIQTKNEEECSICISKIKVKSEVNILPCGHIFHKKCIKEWLNNKLTCPLCRDDVN